jgi:hypothetical protein
MTQVPELLGLMVEEVGTLPFVLASANCVCGEQGIRPYCAIITHSKRPVLYWGE